MSAYNSGVDQNKVNFSNIFWRPSSDGNSPYIWRRIAVYVDVVEYRLDRRLPEYFVCAAQCMANSGNGYAVYVSFCWAANF